MIEIINSERCIKCNLCVLVCPVNVFDKVKRGVPVIARQADCQTCYMCELYCPVDAMYVSPLADACEPVLEQQILEKGLLGSYREVVGWGEGRQPGLPVIGCTSCTNPRINLEFCHVRRKHRRNVTHSAGSRKLLCKEEGG